MGTKIARENRHAKSAAKKTRKKNVQPPVDVSSDRMIAKEQKRQANRIRKQEKRGGNLRLHAQKLETQARKLLDGAQKARARADLLDELKNKEDEEKNKLKKALEEMAQDPENADDVASSSLPNTGEDASNPHANKAQYTDDAKLHEMVLDQIMEKELGPSITAGGPYTEVTTETKCKRKEEEKVAKRKRETETETADATALNMGVMGEDEIDIPKENKKKRKLERTGNDSGGDEAEIPAIKKEKKERKDKKDKKDERKRKKKKVKNGDKEDGDEHVAEESGTIEQVDGNELHKEKNHKKKDRRERKGKKEKQATTEDHVPAPTVEGGVRTNDGDQWNVSALEGDAKRKQKFLRLLGGGKANEGTGGGHTTLTSSSKADIAKMQSDLERQFDVGLKMKQEGHSHRRGLGA